MAVETLSDLGLPVATREALERFCAAAQAALGDRLVAIVLYGGAARGEFSPLNSDLNVMIVLQEATTATLDQLAGPVQQGLRDCRLAPLVLTEDDLRRSTDVFPIKFLDMQRHHRTLWGRDVLAEIRIAEAFLRLRCEQEIKNLLLRLRHLYLLRSHRPELVEGTLVRAISSFLTDLSVLLFLRTGEAPAGKEAVAAAATQVLGLDGAVLRDVLALKAGTYQPSAAELKRVYDALMATVQRAANIVDALPERAQE